MTPEGRVKAKINKALKALGVDCWRFMPVQSGYGTPALDYLLCIRGRFVAIEAKKPGGKLTPLQEGTKAAMEAAGGIVLVIDDEADALAIEATIRVAMEFAPYGTSRNNFESVAACVKIENQNYTGQFQARRLYPEDKGSGLEHERHILSATSLNKAACRDHGALAISPWGSTIAPEGRKN